MLIYGILAALLVGGAAGFGISHRAHKVDASVAAAVEAATRPVVIDAEIQRQIATDVPAACLDPQMSLTAACLWSSCVRATMQAGQRPDCADFQRLATIQAARAMCDGADPCVAKVLEQARVR